jgi:biopolymer transport protein ExbB/TolQ
MPSVSAFLYTTTILSTIIFIVAPFWLTVTVIYRYNRAERAIVNFTAMLRAIMAYLERRQRPDLPLPAPQAEQAKHTNQPFAKILAFFRSRILPEEWLNDLKLRDEYEDYLAIVRYGPSERERYIRLKRKNLSMQQSITEDLEYCRTYTELLPYMGILGTVLGFLFSPAIFTPGASASLTVGGLVVALTSTCAALFCLIVVKMGYENRIIPKAIEFEKSLQVIEDYASRYGDLDVAHATLEGVR